MNHPSEWTKYYDVAERLFQIQTQRHGGYQRQPDEHWKAVQKTTQQKKKKPAKC